MSKIYEKSIDKDKEFLETMVRITGKTKEELLKDWEKLTTIDDEGGLKK